MTWQGVIQRAAVFAMAALVLFMAYQTGRQVGYDAGARDATAVCYCDRGAP